MKHGLELIAGAVVLACLCPQQSPAQSADEAPAGAQAGSAAHPFQNLSPDKRRALIQRIMEKRAGRADSSGKNAGPPVNTDNLTFKSDIAYGPAPLQRLDLYTPKSAKGPLPIVIFVHGGGWHRGDKAQGDRKDKGTTYVNNDVIFISANYRLAPDVMHPKQVEDIASAFAWTKQHASEFGGDPKRIFLMGHSAGAQLVDLLGTNDRFLAAKGLGLKDISGVISLDTASLNLAERTKDSGPETGLVGPMIDAAFGKDPKVLQDGSPTLCIKPGKTYPPFLMFCGSSRMNCIAQHKEFSNAMKKAGGTVTVKAVPLSHGDINRASGQANNDVFKECMSMIKGSD